MAGYNASLWIMLCLFGVGVANAAPASALTPMSLTCYGEGLMRGAGLDAAWAPKVPYHGHVEMRLFSGNDRIQLPKGFRSNMNPRDDGWYKVKNLKAADGEVIGNAIITFIDKPFFRFDRLSRRIDVSGLSGTFAGECRKAD